MWKPKPETGPDITELAGCPDCGAIQALPSLRRGRLRCYRCDNVLERATNRPRGAALALSIATLILLVPGNLLPLLGLYRAGISEHVALAAGVATLWSQGWGPTAIVVTLFAIFLPFLRFGLLAATLATIVLRRPQPWTGPGFRIAEELDLWSMPDVFLIGVAIGYSRLAVLAHVTIGGGGWCYIAAAFTAMLTRATIQRRRVWRSIGNPPAAAGPNALPCLGCDLVLPAQSEGERCPRCRARVRRRRPGSMPVALALTIAGLLFYPVANLFPLSALDWFAGAKTHTLFSAVMKLVGANLWFLAGCVFTTSIAIPFLKLMGMLYLWFSVRRRSTRHLVFKTRFYRIIDELGRWSTMDVFTVVVYLPLLQFGQFASARVGTGLPALLAVVVLTMLASRAFDPRLLWDRVAA